jgi:hypothetical protein
MSKRKNKNKKGVRNQRSKPPQSDHITPKDNAFDPSEVHQSFANATTITGSIPMQSEAMARLNLDEDKLYYVEERRLFDEAELKASTSFDKLIATIATGSLGLSIVFIDKIAHTLNHGTKYLLILSWSSLLAALFFNLLSFMLSQNAIRRQ